MENNCHIIPLKYKRCVSQLLIAYNYQDNAILSKKDQKENDYEQERKGGDVSPEMSFAFSCADYAA